MIINGIITYAGLILYKLMKYLGRYRIINDRIDREPYLERYYIFLKDRNEFPFNVFIHKFLKSDSDDLHDHPWSFISIPLWPGYWEHTLNGRFWRPPLSCRYSYADTLHRVELDNYYRYCWTLFIPCRKIRDWGFNTKDGWIHNEQYLKIKNNKQKLN